MRYTEQIRAQIDKLALAPPARLALFKATTDIFEQMEQKGELPYVSVPRRIATAAFLACDSKACIAIPKLKHTFGTQIVQKHISKVRIALNIPYGTAHEKLDSLCKVSEITNIHTILHAHHYVDLLSEDSAGMPSNIAATALYVADNLCSSNPLSQRDICHLTGCTEITLRFLSKILLRKEFPKKK